MADSKDETMSRLDRIDAALAHLTDVAVLQSERIDGLVRTMDQFARAVSKRFDAVNDRLDGVSERVDRLTDRLDGVSERLDGVSERLDGVSERLDRLTAATLKDRTSNVERFARIELRLARLEEHTGLPPQS